MQQKYALAIVDWSLPPTVAIIVLCGLYLYQPAIDAIISYDRQHQDQMQAENEAMKRAFEKLPPHPDADLGD